MCTVNFSLLTILVKIRSWGQCVNEVINESLLNTNKNMCLKLDNIFRLRRYQSLIEDEIGNTNK